MFSSHARRRRTVLTVIPAKSKSVPETSPESQQKEPDGDWKCSVNGNTGHPGPGWWVNKVISLSWRCGFKRDPAGVEAVHVFVMRALKQWKNEGKMNADEKYRPHSAQKEQVLE